MAIERVDENHKKMVIFHSFVNVYRRVYMIIMTQTHYDYNHSDLL